MDTAKGLDIGDSYLIRHACLEFGSAIADVHQCEIKGHLAHCNFVSVIVDGSTDSSINENEMVHLQSCQKGIIKTNFIQCCQVQRGTASGIVHAIERAVETVMTLPQCVNKQVALDLMVLQ